MLYRFIAVDPRPQSRAEALATLTAEPTLGVEVTVPELAEACRLGNIDPQHLGGDASTAAIEAAVTWPLPDYGTVLATVRADADALGAMAWLHLRKELADYGHEGETIIDQACTLMDGTVVQGGTGMVERARLIAVADKEAAGPWPGPRPVDGPHSILRDTTALEAMCMDHRLTVEDRVRRMRDWLLSGQFPGQGEYQERAETEAQEALASLNVKVHGPIALVTGSHRLAMGLGYRYAPVVVATNPKFSFAGGEPHRKHTVARWNSQTMPDMNWESMVAELNKKDPAAQDGSRWGGSSSIVGSPQGVASGLSTADVHAAVLLAVMGL